MNTDKTNPFLSVFICGQIYLERPGPETRAYCVARADGGPARHAPPFPVWRPVQTGRLKEALGMGWGMEPAITC